jgi:hypothetical protein
MPNVFAYLVLLSWPLVALALFRLLSIEKALIWTLISGHLLLPSETFIKFPMIPALDRAFVPALSAMLLCLIFAPRRPASSHLSAQAGRQVIFALLAVVIVTPVLTVLHNTEPIIEGRVFLPGLRLYDGFGLIVQVVVSLIPFWLGLKYLNTRESHIALLHAIAISALFYTLPALIEIRLSPQLHRWVYGFFPQDFIQHIRDGSFRPLVFLNHGLMLGIFLCMAVISALVLFREALREGRPASQWLLAAAWLTLVLFLSKNLGAFLIAAFFGAVVLFLGRRLQVMLAISVGVIVILYPMLRGAGWIPVDTVHNLALSINEDRAASLKFRLDNEDALLAHANEKPVSGWGSWGRNSLYDPETGQMTSITDGIWLILIGVYGWVGYIGRFGLLTVPILFFAMRSRTFGPSLVTAGLMMLLCANLIDLLPNAGLVNYVWLIAGALAGYALSEGSSDTVSAAQRASWLAPEKPAALQSSQRPDRKRRTG